jgi:hypothetical protein
MSPSAPPCKRGAGLNYGSYAACRDIKRVAKSALLRRGSALRSSLPEGVRGSASYWATSAGTQAEDRFACNSIPHKEGVAKK